MEMWHRGWDDEGALREKVAERNRQPEEDCTRLRPSRGVEMGQALLHLPEKERGDHHPAKGRLRALVLQRHLAKRPEAHSPKDRRGAGGPWIKFTSPKEISALQPTLRSYIYEAIEVEESGKKVPLKKPSEYVVPEELQVRLNAAPELKTAFEALTPGRRKSYIFHVSGAKQAKTRAARAEKCVPTILSGRGFNERTD